jgi:hypothetical protein
LTSAWESLRFNPSGICSNSEQSVLHDLPPFEEQDAEKIAPA